MPQLMPLMWYNSVMMIMLIVFMLMEMFYYKFSYNFSKMYFDNSYINKEYKW